MAEDARLKDDPGIDDGQALLRRIHPKQIKDDGSPSSAAFHNQGNADAFSVVISCLLDDPTDYELVLESHPGYALASFTVGEARSLDQGVTHEIEDDEPAHGHVNGSKKKPTSRKFVRLSTMVFTP